MWVTKFLQHKTTLPVLQNDILIHWTQTEVMSHKHSAATITLEAYAMLWSISPVYIPVASICDPKHLNSFTTSTAIPLICKGTYW